MPIEGTRRFYAECLAAKHKRDRPDRSWYKVGTYIFATSMEEAEAMFRSRWLTNGELTVREAPVT